MKNNNLRWKKTSEFIGDNDSFERLHFQLSKISENPQKESNNQKDVKYLRLILFSLEVLVILGISIIFILIFLKLNDFVILITFSTIMIYLFYAKKIYSLYQKMLSSNKRQLFMNLKKIFTPKIRIILEVFAILFFISFLIIYGIDPIFYIIIIIAYLMNSYFDEDLKRVK